MSDVEKEVFPEALRALRALVRARQRAEETAARFGTELVFTDADGRIVRTRPTFGAGSTSRDSPQIASAKAPSDATGGTGSSG